MIVKVAQIMCHVTHIYNTSSYSSNKYKQIQFKGITVRT